MSTLTATIMDTARASLALSTALLQARIFLRRFVVLSTEQATTVSLWAAHTHAVAAAECTPYLQVTSATKRAGKTRLLEVLEPLVAAPWFTGRTTAAALVRKIDASSPTLLLDESDAAFGGEKEYAEALRGVLNTGYRRSGKATICVGQNAHITVRDFRTFCPKAIAGIGRLPDTVGDRSIPIALRRRRTDERCERWREREGHQDGTPIRDALAAALGPMQEHLRDARPTLPPDLSDRQADVWEPLLAIADAAGADWATMARSAATALAGSVDDEDIAVELLGDIRDILAKQNPGAEGIRTATLLESLAGLEERPWATWRKGDKPLTAHGLRRLLKPFDIHPDRFTDDAGAQVRGYRRNAFEDAVARYLSIKVSKCLSTNKTGPESPISECLGRLALDDSENAKTSITTGEKTLRHFETGETRIGRTEREADDDDEPV